MPHEIAGPSATIQDQAPSLPLQSTQNAQITNPPPPSTHPTHSKRLGSNPPRETVDHSQPKDHLPQALLSTVTPTLNLSKPISDSSKVVEFPSIHGERRVGLCAD
ncbi:UNVERIFIED_CONTAM: hypothetical protein Sradi_1774800 [Sesamum radiatum]|uniref:Uncharacterized protein n=1 Tax=Sesamum radiatum TaxID=300843 RepID=A0AAW2TV28_SESRA